MTGPLPRLRILENRYTGPVPAAALDAALHVAPAPIRQARDSVRFYRRWTEQAIEASRRRRHAVAAGHWDHQTPHQRTARGAALAANMIFSVRQYVFWRAHLHKLERITPA